MVLEQAIVNSLIAGSIYSLIAIGFSLVYAMDRFFHIAHGGMFLIGAFTSWYIFAEVGLPLYIAIPAAVIAAIIVGWLIDYIVYRPLKHRKNRDWPLFLASFGAFIIIQNLILLIFGGDVKTFGFTIERGYELWGGAIITKIQIMVIAISAILSYLVFMFLGKTKLGKAIRATSNDKEVSQLSGINTATISSFTMALSSALAAVAGIMVGLEQNLDQTIGFIAVLKGISAAIVGGIGNVAAGLFGGLFLGLAENIGIVYLPSGYKDAIAFAVLILFLIFRPHGFFGTKKREK